MSPRLLHKAGVQPYNPLIGEFVTSLDMAGMSLSLFWLDDELKSLLDATASSPAFTSIGPDIVRGGDVRGGRAPTTARVPTAQAAPADDDTPGGKMGEQARAALRQALATIEEIEAELGRLDAAAGDGDHGAGMVRGLRAAVGAIDGFGGTARQTLRPGRHGVSERGRRRLRRARRRVADRHRHGIARAGRGGRCRRAGRGAG